MKKFFLQIVLLVLVGCGQGGSEFGNPGTVIVKAGIGGASGEPSISKLTAEASADEVLVRTYSFSLGDSEDCSTAAFIDVFDETSDTSDCIHEPDDTSLFMDIAESPTIATNNSIDAGTYSCIRVTICDQLVWEAGDLVNDEGEELCPAPQVSDIEEPQNEAEVITFYYSINGTMAEDEDEGEGAIDDPFLLTDPVTVTAGETTTLVVGMSNNDAGDDFVAEYDSESEEGHQCEVPPPTMTITVE